MNAVLIRSPAELEWVKGRFGQSAKIMAHEWHTVQLVKDSSVEYLFPSSRDGSEQYDLLRRFSFNWYRDDQGIDVSCESGVSIGTVLSCSAWVSFSNILRQYTALSRLLERFERVYFLCNEPSRFARLAGEFGDRVECLESPRLMGNLHSSFAERVLGGVQLPSNRERLKRAFQWLIRPYLMNRTLTIPDWTSGEHLSRNALFIGGRNPFRSACGNISASYLEEAERKFPEENGSFLSLAQLRNAMARIKCDWPSGLLHVFLDYLVRSYNQNRWFFIKWYAIQSEMLDFYKPLAVEVPGEVYEPYAIMLLAANERGIKTHCRIDGYPYLSMMPNLRDRVNDSWLISKFYSYDDATRRLYLRSGIDDQDILPARASIVAHHENLASSDNQYDVIIMSWIPNSMNPEAREEYHYQIAVDVIRLVLALGFKSIALKVKAEFQLPGYRRILEAEGLADKIPILSGGFFQHVKKARSVIGGISTAIFEATHHRIPYYIYEPLENGFCSSILARSEIQKLVARNIGELEMNLRDGLSALETEPTLQ